MNLLRGAAEAQKGISGHVWESVLHFSIAIYDCQLHYVSNVQLQSQLQLQNTITTSLDRHTCTARHGHLKCCL